MKPFFTVAVACCVFNLNANAQSWTAASPNIYFNGGNVGIGTNAPADLLTLNTGAARKGITIIGDGDISAYSDFQMGAANITGIPTGAPVGWVISYRKDGYFSNNTHGLSSLEFYCNLKSGGYVAPMSFKSNGDIILASTVNTLLSGNVGIGTTKPDSKLTVNGGIHAKSVVVDINIPVPDYVFDHKYILPSLADVEVFVEKNHHLPEVPSAAEIKKNGLDVGEMNALLLKKVEELTLYMIEKDQQIKVLQQQNGVLEQRQAQINELKKQVEELIKAKK